MEQPLAPGNLLEQIRKVVDQIRLPGLDAAAVIEGRRKDIEALAEANKVALTGVQDLVQKQAEILNKTLEQLQSVIQEGKASGSIPENSTQLGELVQKTLHNALGNMRELAELAYRSQSDALRIVYGRAQQNIEELKALLPRRKA
jgi:phasin family protein